MQMTRKASEPGRFMRCIALSGMQQIKIGNSAQCDIRLSTLPKDVEITLQQQKVGWLLRKTSQEVHVYKNATEIVQSTILDSMDFFSINEVCFYLRDHYVFVDKDVQMNVQGLPEAVIAEQTSALQYPTFMRSVRVQHEVQESKIEVLPPKAKKEEKKENLLVRVIPTVAMMLGMLVMRSGMGNGGGNAWMYLIYMGISVGVSIGVSVWTSRERNRDSAVENTQRKERYMDYMKGKIDEIRTQRQDELRILHRIYRPMSDNIATVTNFDKGLFDRCAQDRDFLDVRIGVGEKPASAQVSVRAQDFKDSTDELMDLPEEIEKRYRVLEDAPIVTPLKEANAIGVVGARKWLYELLKNMVIDLSVRHYFKELKLYFVLDEAEQGQFSFLRWLKHCHMEDSTIRSLLCDEESTKHHLENLYKILSEREDGARSRSSSENTNWPVNYVIFAYRIDAIRNHPISQYFERCAQLGVHFIFMDEFEERIPRGCAEIIRLDRKECKGTLISSSNSELATAFRYTTISDRQARELVKKICPVYVVESSLEGEMAKNISLYELLGIRTAGEMNLGQIWKASRVDKSMAAPLGVKTKGEVVALDLHEKAHGPHGLVAGTTGSGKSEIIQSYILSMVLRFHPHDVGFLIIDFKGGGMVNQFEKLPHLIGAITNIDGREIDRSLKSIKAELLRRQALFAQQDVNRIDAYILKHKENPIAVPIPLPHLIIVVDEFAELKSEHPDFMKELISAARIGRSLGVHLILATQKPSGVVDDQIWSNSKFKLCLKVQTKEDSQEVLKTPLAAEIREPGRSYLQVGNNEIFELFQSAYSGADVPDETAASKKDERIYELNMWGKKRLVYDSQAGEQAKADSQLTALVNYVHDYCTAAKVDSLPNICLPPLEQSFPLNALEGTKKDLEKGIVVSVAKYDDPEQQYQGDYRLNLSESNTFLMGSAQMGKTTALQTILYSAIMNYTPEEVTFYIIDAGNMALKVFENARHVGGVAMIQEEEKISNLFKLMHTMIHERKAVFASKGIGTYKAYIEAGLRGLPQVVFVIDNIAAFKEYYDTLNEELQTLSRECSSVGITMLITGSQVINLGYRTLANFGTRIAFTCNETSEYASLLGRCRMEPYEYPGRALVMLEKRIVEAQFALCTEGTKEIERMDNLKKQLIENSKQYRDTSVVKIPEVPDLLTLRHSMEEMPELFKRPYVLPIGMDYEAVSYQSIPLAEMGYIAISGKDGAGKSGFVRMLLSQLDMQKHVHDVETYIIDHQRRKLERASGFSHVKEYTTNAEEGLAIIARIAQIVDERKTAMDAIATAQEEEALHKTWPLLLVVIQSGKIFDQMNADAACAGKVHRMIAQCTDCKVCFVFGDFPNAQIGYSASEVLKYVRDSKNLLFFENIAAIKAVDVSVRLQRELSKPIMAGDAHRFIGEDVVRIKTMLHNE